MIWRFRIKAAKLLFVLAMLVAPARGAGGIFISDDSVTANMRRHYKRLNSATIEWMIGELPK